MSPATQDSTTPLYHRTAQVRVPASSANLGPGFDSFGLALALYDTVSLTAFPPDTATPGLEVVIHGEGESDIPRDERHLMVKTVRDLWGRLGLSQPSIRLETHNVIPHGRGLGSSAAAIVAALLAAHALVPVERQLTRERLLAIATDIEGHPDNVAPVLFGNLTISWMGAGTVGGEESVRFESFGLDPQVAVVVAVPDYQVSTEKARDSLPQSVPFTDAVQNSSRAGLLSLALTSRPGLLWEATQDLLHQPYRREVMQPSAYLMEALRQAQIPSVISGAGPTVLAFVPQGQSEQEIVSVVQKLVQEQTITVAGQNVTTWTVQNVDIDTKGATVEVH